MHILQFDNFQDLMSEMSDKIDASATRQLRGLEPTEASRMVSETLVRWYTQA